MRKSVLLAALTVAALPASLMAHASDDVRKAGNKLREEQYELDRAYAYGDHHEIDEEQRDVDRARRKYHEERREARERDWNYRGWRRYDNHYGYQGGYRSELPRPGWDRRWVNDHGDAVLIDSGSGRVLRVVRGYYR
jgi:Ni/Co efflux regulator RcnB